MITICTDTRDEYSIDHKRASPEILKALFLSFVEQSRDSLTCTHHPYESIYENSSLQDICSERGKIKLYYHISCVCLSSKLYNVQVATVQGLAYRISLVLN